MGGVFGETATYLPGRRVPGVRLTEDVTDIHLSLAYGAPVFATAQQVRTAVAALVPGPVNVTVEDRRTTYRRCHDHPRMTEIRSIR